MKWAITLPNDDKWIHGFLKTLEERKSKNNNNSRMSPIKRPMFFFIQFKHLSIMGIQQPTERCLCVSKTALIFLVKPSRLNQPWCVLCQRTQTPNDLGSQIRHFDSIRNCTMLSFEIRQDSEKGLENFNPLPNVTFNTLF